VVKNRTLEAFSGGCRRISKPSFGGAECKKEKDYAGTHRRKKRAPPPVTEKTALFGARRP
jgi:hypothetical protein